MAYLHCHTKGCGWSQDDFWDFKFKIRYVPYRKSWWKFRLDIGYNPISNMLDNITWHWKPKKISFDKWIINDILEYTGVKIKVYKVEKIEDQSKSNFKQRLPNGEIPDKIKYTEYQVFSWSWLWVELVREWKNIKRQKWWTYNSWIKARDTAVCPKCGLRNFDID